MGQKGIREDPLSDSLRLKSFKGEGKSKRRGTEDWVKFDPPRSNGKSNGKNPKSARVEPTSDTFSFRAKTQIL